MAFVKPVHFDSFEMRLSFKAEKKNYSCSDECDNRALMSGCSHTSNPHCDAQTCISGKEEAGGKTVAGVRRLSHTSSPRICQVSAWEGFCFVQAAFLLCCERCRQNEKGGATSLRFFALLCIVRLMSSASLLSFCNQHFEKVRVVILPRC